MAGETGRPATSAAAAGTAGLPSRTLGRTGLSVSVLGFGGAPLGELYATLDEDVALATVERALVGGVTLLDTSPLYGHGLSEHRIGAALRRSRGARPALCTKVGRVANPFAPRVTDTGYAGGFPHALEFDYSRDGAMRSLEQSLLRLGTDRVDLALVHDVDRRAHGDAVEFRFREAMAGAVPALAALRDAGVVSGVGVGVNEADMAERFLREGAFDVVLLAGRYSLLEQPALASLLPLAEAEGVGVLLGGVFNSGILATGPRPGARYDYEVAPPAVLAKAAALQTVCGRHGVALADAALRFALAHPAVGCAVLGAVSPAEVDAQIASLRRLIPPALWADLKAQGLLPPEAPVPNEAAAA